MESDEHLKMNDPLKLDCLPGKQTGGQIQVTCVNQSCFFL